MFDTIINPLTGKSVRTHSHEGLTLLKQYVHSYDVQNGGNSKQKTHSSTNKEFHDKWRKYQAKLDKLDNAMKKLADEVANNPFKVTPVTKNMKNKKKQKVKPPCRINHKSTRCARYGTTNPESCMVSEKGWCKKKRPAKKRKSRKKRTSKKK